MANRSRIEWTEATWNFLTGCTKISPGCVNCNAERFAKRMAGRNGYPKDNPFKVTFHPDRMDLPLRWKKPRMIFVNSMSDLFHEDVPEDIIQSAFDVMSRAYWHTFQILTKRPEKMFKTLSQMDRLLSNVWLGVTVENKDQLGRIEHLLQTPAVVRFVSVEPMLSPVYFTKIAIIECPTCNDGKRWANNPVPSACYKCGRQQSINSKIDWIVCGGETGPGARPIHPDWARSLRNQCQAAGIPFFFKQWGEFLHVSQGATPLSAEQVDGVKSLDYLDGQAVRVGKKAAGRLLDGRKWEDYPQNFSRFLHGSGD